MRPVFLSFLCVPCQPCRSCAGGQKGSAGWDQAGVCRVLGRLGRPRDAHMASVSPVCLGKPAASAAYSCLCDWAGIAACGCCSVTPLPCLRRVLCSRGFSQRL